MKRFALLFMLMLGTAAVFAQAPKGWKMRVDRSASASDPDAAGTIKFMAMGGGFHFVNPQAAVFWNPSNTAGGSYTLKGTFTLMKPSGHTNYYGLVFGGSNLEGAQQKYTYFLVAQDGTFLVKKRDGEATSDVVKKTPSASVKQPGGDGKSTNALEVRVGGDKIDYVVNGKVVQSTPKAGIDTNGVYGIRINHLLEVMVDGFGVSK